jgi:hypothetical protein
VQRTVRKAAETDTIAGVSLGFSNSLGERTGTHRAITEADLIEISVLLKPRRASYRSAWAGLETDRGLLPVRANFLESQMYRRALASA